MPIPIGFDFASVSLLATLSTQIIVNGETYRCIPGGTREECTSQATGYDPVREAEITTLSPGVAFFSSDDFPLGKIRIFNDPRISISGKVIYSKDASGNAVAPALSTFYQVMVFHIIPHTGDGSGEQWLYGGAIWEVNAVLNGFPPINRQYYHAPSSVPLYNLITGLPSGINKGISTITLGEIATPSQQSYWHNLYNSEVALFNALPSKMAPPSVPSYA